MMFYIGLVIGCMLGLFIAGMMTAGKTEDLYNEIERLKRGSKA